MIPDYQTIMLPLLKICADGKEHTLKEAREILVNTFQLTDEERNKLLPKGGKSMFSNRVGWAKVYLSKAGLLESTKLATFRITHVGMATLKENLECINIDYLMRFPSFVAFKSGKQPSETAPALCKAPEEETDVLSDQQQTPEEMLEQNYNVLRASLASDLLDKVLELSPSAFEKLVLDLLIAMGYGGGYKESGAVTGKPGDGGIDGMIKEDKLGLDTIYIQAKRWAPDRKVGGEELQKFAGALTKQGAKKGVFITTSDFTKDALDFTQCGDLKMVLINGITLAEYMIDYDLGCATQKTYLVKRIDNDFFDAQ